MKGLGFKDYFKKFTSRIVYLLAIVASAIIIAAYDHYYGTPGREAMIVLLGVLIGMVVIIFLEYLDHTLRTPNGVRFYAKMPFAGEVPPALRKDASKDVIDKIVRIKPDDLMAEVFRNIRVNVLFSSSGEKPMDAIMVSSSVLSEGKTFVAANMAITFVQAHKGDNTLLIDGKKVGPSHHLMNVPYSQRCHNLAQFPGNKTKIIHHVFGFPRKALL